MLNTSGVLSKKTIVWGEVGLVLYCLLRIIDLLFTAGIVDRVNGKMIEAFREGGMFIMLLFQSVWGLAYETIGGYLIDPIVKIMSWPILALWVTGTTSQREGLLLALSMLTAFLIGSLTSPLFKFSARLGEETSGDIASYRLHGYH